MKDVTDWMIDMGKKKLADRMFKCNKYHQERLVSVMKKKKI